MTFLSMRNREIREEEERRSGIDMEGVAEYFLATDFGYPPSVHDFHKAAELPKDWVSYLGRGA